MKRESPDALQARISGLIFEVHGLRDRARRSMYGLQREFNDEFADAFLRLRPWSRRRGQPPYSLCWIRIFAGKYKLDPKTLSAEYHRNPWPFRRLLIHSNRDLDTVIHRCQLDAHRTRIFDFHRKAQALNQASHASSHALDRVRKLLSGRAADGPWDEGGPDLSAILPETCTTLTDRLRQWTSCVSAEIAALRKVADDYRRAPWRVNLDLVFVQDLGFPFGRLLWTDRPSGLEFARLGRRLRRRLFLDSPYRALLTRVERAMSRLARLLVRRHATFQKMIRLLATAQSTAEPILNRIKPPRTMAEVMNDFRDNPSTMAPAPWKGSVEDSEWEESA